MTIRAVKRSRSDHHGHGWIRRLHRRGKKSGREIARLTGLSRNTVAKWLHAPVTEPPKYRRRAVVTKLTPFQETLKLAL
jgi:transposase